MSERFERMKAERDALYQATLPVKASPMAMALRQDRLAEWLTKEVEGARRRRAEWLALYQKPRDNGH